MAKADGLVTTAEIAAFREIFVIHPEETRNVARVFNLAKQDAAGYLGTFHARVVQQQHVDGLVSQTFDVHCAAR